MPIAVRHRHDPTSRPEPLPDLRVQRGMDAALLAAVQGKSEAQMTRRLEAGHRAYLAWWAGRPAAWGWVATRWAEIGEVGSTFEIPEGERYLWNFVTLPRHRGKGIYPTLLDAIVRAESREAERFWIAWAPENHASASGIHKAGFTTIADLSFDVVGRPALRARVLGGGALAARVFGLPEVETALAPCWRCAREAAPRATSCAAGRCACDYQRAESGCAA